MANARALPLEALKRKFSTTEEKKRAPVADVLIDTDEYYEANKHKFLSELRLLDIDAFLQNRFTNYSIASIQSARMISVPDDASRERIKLKHLLDLVGFRLIRYGTTLPRRVLEKGPRARKVIKQSRLTSLPPEAAEKDDVAALHIASIQKANEERNNEASSSSDSDSAEKTAGFECIVCFERCHPNDTITCPDMAHSVCLPCFRDYIEKTVPVGYCGTVQCPGCKICYNAIHVKKALPEKTWKEMERKQIELDRQIATNGTVMYCACGTVGVVCDKEAKTVTCPSCKKRYCLLCGDFAHESGECKAPKPTMEWVYLNNAKACPNCGEYIQKNRGCNCLSCRCKHKFCWLCLKKWKTCDCKQMP